jgi:hypothetical protein
MFLRSCKDYFDMHREFHIEFLSIPVDIHNENHHYLSCNCLDSCKVVKHKDHLIKAKEIERALQKYFELLTIFTSLTTIARWTLAGKSTKTI